MKTPRFWYPRQDEISSSLLPILLSPFSWVFQMGTLARRIFAKPYRAHIPVICVGNVVAGGAGKTPTCLALAHILRQQGHKPVFVTRGYGGSCHGRNVTTCVNLAKHSVADVGDEALLLAAMAPTWVGSDRIAAVRQAESHGTIIIMDDGLQNPSILPTSAILVVDGEVGIGNGQIIPVGPLRESLANALEKVVAVILLGESDTQNLAARIKQPIFRACLQPDLPLGFPRTGKFVAFAGIARPEKFYTTARNLGLDIADTCDFPDHHVFSFSDIDILRLRAEEQGARLLTTEKDAVRLAPAFRAEILTLPVKLTFNAPGAEPTLLRLVLN